MKNRIPAYDSTNPDGMHLWFAELSAQGLLFHPEEEPENIICIENGLPVFTQSEASTVRSIMTSMYAEHGDDVIKACYPIFMRAVGQRLDA